MKSKTHELGIYDWKSICAEILSNNEIYTYITIRVDLWSIQFWLTDRTIYPIAMWDTSLVQPNFQLGNSKSVYSSKFTD